MKSKKLFSVILIVALVLFMIPATALMAGEGGTTASSKSVAGSVYSGFEGGEGTAENPFQIATPAQLELVRDYLGQHFKLTANINLEDYDDWEPIGAFEPLSDDPEDAETADPELAFTGTFDGNGKTISNLTINQPTGMAVGLFGCVIGTEANPSSIYDLTVENVDVAGNYLVGGVVGHNASNSILDNVDLIGSNNTVQGSQMVGGITGGGFGDLIDCDAAADIEVLGDDGSMAGVLGGGLEDCSVTNCTATGTVTAAGDDCYGLGGLAGCVFQSLSVENCTADVTIEAGENSCLIGGLLGFTGTYEEDNPTVISDCSATAVITAPDSASRIGGLVGGGFYLEIYKDYFPTPSIYRIDGCETDGSITGGSEALGSIAGHSYQSTVENCTSTLTINGNNNPPQVGLFENGAISFAGGRGTEIDPYQIATPAQLNQVRDYLDKHFILTADISLAGYDNWKPIGILTYSTDINMETGEMDMSKVFSGSFDGDTHKISDIMAATDGDMVAVGGLFACSTGTVKDLTLENVTVNGDETTLAAGGVVGYAMDGEISNVTLTGANTVTGTNCVGGIAGGSMVDVSGCTVEDVDIIVIGDNDFHAEDSETKGRIIQCDVAECGGLVVGGGFTGSVKNCTATGTVTAEGNEPVGLGGIGGALQCMTEISGNTATVTITTTQGGHAIGGLCGYAGMGDDGSGYDQDGNYNASLRTVAPPCQISSNIVNVTINAPGATHVGGLVGTGLYFYGMEDRFNVTDCTVTGDIIAGTDASSPYGVTTPGAVAGRAVGNNVDGCTFTGLTINEAAATNKVGVTSLMYESADQYDDDVSGALLYGLTDTYQPLFEGAIFNDSYSDYWYDYCAAIVGEDNAADTAAALKFSIGGELYGQDAVEEYGDDLSSAQFFCGFTGGEVATFTFNGSQISGYNADGAELFSHPYRYVGEEPLYMGTTPMMDAWLFESLDDNSGQFKYFLMCGDTPGTTYHIEFRYGSERGDNLNQFITGDSAYWLAAGIPTSALEDEEETLLEQVIALFCLENMDYTADRTSGSLSQISDLVGTWDYYIDGQAQPDTLYFVVDADGNGRSYWQGQEEPARYYQVFAYDNDGSASVKSGIYVAREDEPEAAKYTITTNSAGKTILTLTGEAEGEAFTISYIQRTGIMSPFAGGSGTVEDPYQIATPAQLDAVRNYLDQHFKLTANINLEDYDNWQPIGAFQPLGDEGEAAETPRPEVAFTGTFDGNDKTISNLTVNQPEGMGVGLFGCAVGTEENPSSIYDLTVENVDVTGYFLVGGVVGHQGWYCTLENVNLTGSNTIRGYFAPGGITGATNGDLKNCHAAADIEVVDGGYSAGILVGGTGRVSLTDCTATGTLTTEGDNCFGLGGLSGVPSSAVEIRNCHAEGVTITALGENNTMIGGLVGFTGTYGEEETPTLITGCSADATIVVSESTEGVGGLVGGGLLPEVWAEGRSEHFRYTIRDSTTSGSITGGGSAVGSIAGHSYRSTVENCTSTMTVNGDSNSPQVGWRAVAQTLTEDDKNLVITADTPEELAITVPAGVTGATVSVSALLGTPDSDGNISAALPALNITAIVPAVSATDPIQVSIPAGTIVSAPEGWDGTINMPTIRSNDSVTVNPDSGKTATVNTVIEIGFGDVPLTFDQAVRILIPGQAGKDAGYIRGGTFTKITNTLSADSQAAGDALAAGGDGKIDASGDLVVWTKHFTQFVTYTQTAKSSGGGRGGGGSSSTTTSTTETETVTPGAEDAASTGSETFKDITGHWAFSNIEKLVALKAISGYPDGSFRPDSSITRAEFATVLAKAFKLTPQSGKTFTDTANHWARDYIGAVTAGGIASGYSDSVFGPDDLITREQMAVMIVKAAELSPATGETSFADRGSISEWAQEAMAAAVENKIMTGYPDNTVRPQANATRAEAVTVIVQALK
ncbi:MAG TPA: S-layer homology domain-containing protein [Negativicutes bacterium]|nr:S-layer homology domain-containing protein [Negativicutes bacterium]